MCTFANCQELRTFGFHKENGYRLQCLGRVEESLSGNMRKLTDTNFHRRKTFQIYDENSYSNEIISDKTPHKQNKK